MHKIFGRSHTHYPLAKCFLRSISQCTCKKTNQIKPMPLSQIDHVARAYTYLHNFIASYFSQNFVGQILGFQKSYETRRLIIGSDTTSGKTARGNTPSEALVFHQTLSTPKASYTGRYPSGTPQGRTRKIHIFPQGCNNENELQYLIHYILPEFLKITLLHFQSESAEY